MTEIINFEEERKENEVARKRAEAIVNKMDGTMSAEDKMVLRTWKAEREKFRENYPQDRETIAAVLGVKPE